MTLYPLKFRPWLRTMVWGGEKIAPYKGVQTTQTKIGESWEISGVQGHVTDVACGPLEGRSLTSLVQEFKGALVGEKVYAAFGDEFPLLIKFIDPASDLSIQVHPDDAMAERVHGPGQKGKTEMWYVVSADPGSYLLSGLSESITPADYVRLVAENKITSVLSKHMLSPGDVFFLPAGRIHAIGKGAFITEIQQTSDYTYRIWDYGRLGLDGKPRELHTDLAKQAIDYKVYPSYRTTYTPLKNARVPLVSCPYFVTDLYDLDPAVGASSRPEAADLSCQAPTGYLIDLSGLDSFMVVICVEGSGTLEAVIPDSPAVPCPDASPSCPAPTGRLPVPIRQGETVLIPACATSLRLSGTLKVLTSHL